MGISSDTPSRTLIMTYLCVRAAKGEVGGAHTRIANEAGGEVYG